MKSKFRNHIYLLNVPKVLRRDSWIKDHDFGPWFRILTWAVGLAQEDVSLLRILYKRIRGMYVTQGKRRNLRFVYSYLKEAYTITVAVRVSSTYTPKVGVRVGKVTGFPLLIPGRIRNRLLSDRRLYIAVLTMLGIHRIIPWWPDVDLKTVTDPFNGTRQTIQGLKKAKSKLLRLAGVKSLSFRNLKAQPLFIQSAGPNGSVAWMFVVHDMIGILRYPSYWIALLQWFYFTRSWFIITSFIVVTMGACCAIVFIAFRRLWWRVAAPLYSGLVSWRSFLLRKNLENSPFPKWIFYDFHDTSLLTAVIFLLKLTLPKEMWIPGKELLSLTHFNLSRLSVVYKTAGKARVIGITNYWVQVALYPLHKEIFKFLGKLPTDGTYNQLGPVWALRADGSKYYSYDLSAATDRIPRLIQRDVLCQYITPRLADLWCSLVDMPFKFRDDVVKYAVGQPMGAYSSWAMLALTHHMIVQSSSKTLVENYAILGDDVIVPEVAAPSYLAIMQSLGVGISLAKSIVSSEMVEFAKRVRSLDGEDLSIIGPGLIMSAVRHRWLSALVLADSIQKGLFRWTEAPNLLRKIPGSKKPEDDSLFGSLVLFGPKALLRDSQANAVFPPGKARALSQLAEESSWSLSHIVDFLQKEESKKWENARSSAAEDGRMFSTLVWRFFVPRFGVILGLIMFLTFWFSPIPPYVIRRIGEILEGEVPWAKYNDRSRWDLPSIIHDYLDGHPELFWSLQEAPTNQKVVSCRRFYKRLMNSFPWMPDLRPRVSISFKGATMDRPAQFFGDASMQSNLGPKFSFGSPQVGEQIIYDPPAKKGEKPKKHRIFDVIL